MPVLGNFLEIVNRGVAAIGDFFTQPVSATTKTIVNFETNVPAANMWVEHVSFNGEKNVGEIGPIRNYIPDQEALRIRSWQAYLESDIAQIALNRKTVWLIGDGLRLQAEPNELVLKSEGISINRQKFSELVEARFETWAGSTSCHYAEAMNLNQLQQRAYFNSRIGGDVLVILRYEDGRRTIQLIDGCHVCTPWFSSTESKLANGNTINRGVESDPRGKTVAFHIHVGIGKWERVEAINSASGLKQAYLVYGMKMKLGDKRGYSILSGVLEKGAKLDRYVEAAVGSAEERQKITYFITHNQFSTGENPILQDLVQARDINRPIGAGLPTTEEGEKLAGKMAVTTNKQTFNMPPGSDLKAISSDQEMFFRDFLTINFDMYCAAIGIPPNVAAQKYDANFSASRAALKDWEHSLEVERSEFSFEFLAPIYAWFLHIDILEGKLRAPGYVQAVSDNNVFVTESYRKARYVGRGVPHIDPVKEVQAERLKLGTSGAHIPLTTVENAVEALGGKDSDSIAEQFSEELKQSEGLGIKPEPPPNSGGKP